MNDDDMDHADRVLVGGKACEADIWGRSLFTRNCCEKDVSIAGEKLAVVAGIGVGQGAYQCD